ncbi:hypothetical protein FMEXI_12157 [Fusarium mexicanum]|uniref:Uncharacterized protein n=1 Tax=Fusarium mexicanum TaxID=751941 RepID=A0A8H5MLZ6_9HYPO|nr:hypothetical protein FMEXI_12157 [Fusarium mexicanum]
MGDIFAALDDIHVEIKAFTLQETVEYDSRSLSEPGFCKESQWNDRTVLIDAPASEELSNRSICSLSSLQPFVEKRCRQIELHKNNTSVRLPGMQDKVEKKIYDWLSKLPDQPNTNKQSQERHPIKVEERPRRNRRRTDALSKPPKVSNIEEVEESRIVKENMCKDKDSQAHVTSNPAGVLDGYHAALLHIHMLSGSESFAYAKNLRPSMRRQCPRGMENDGDCSRPS